MVSTGRLLCTSTDRPIYMRDSLRSPPVRLSGSIVHARTPEFFSIHWTGNVDSTELLKPATLNVFSVTGDQTHQYRTGAEPEL